MEENKNFHPVTEDEMKQLEENRDWFCDDFELHFRGRIPKHRALSVYRPKIKKRHRMLRNPVFAAVVSSIVTCCLCLSVFSLCFQKETEGSVLPQAGAVLSYGDSNQEIVQLATSSAGGTLSIPDVYDVASPAVVSIQCKSQGGAYVQSQLSSGSGIILRHDGYIVTNNHVVDGAAEVTVITIAGQSLPAKIVGADAQTDLAVLKVEADTALPFAELGDSSLLRVGEMALAIGNPLREELAGTLTVGYISAINRSMVIDGKQMTMIQTDAAINPGNSGGALLNMFGQVIGINTAKSTGYDVEGLGFAIPINEARPVIESIIKHGYVTGRVLIGIKGLAITEAISKANNLPVGVYIQEIIEGSSAAKAGLRAGDVIVSMDGKSVKSIDEINKIRDAHKVGDVIAVTIVRGGKTQQVRMALQEEKPGKAATPAPQQYQQIPFPFSWFGW